MIELCLQVMELLEGKDYVTAFLLEHPEDLGAVATFKRKAKKLWFQPIASTVRPASIWQLQRLRSLEHHAKVCTRVFHQCLFGATSPKPTRILTSLQYLNTLGWTGWPELHPATGVYQGPLPYRCTCGASHQQLIARGSDGSFLTTAAAAYPPRLDELFATAVWDWITSLHRLKRVETNAAVVINEMDAKNVKTNAAVGINEMETKDDLEAKNDSEAKNDLVVNNDAVPKNDLPADVFIAVKKDGAIGGSRRSEAGPSVGPPSKKIRRSQLEVWYKGRFRRASDGLGKSSPGIRPSSNRPRRRSKAASTLATSFWEEVVAFTDAMSKQERLKMMASLALGKFDSSPFGDKISHIRKKLDQVVTSLGKHPGRRQGDRETDIQFRRLKAWAELVEDEDHTFLHALASRGVPVGARGEIGRVAEVYDAKIKGEQDGAPSSWEDDFRASDRDNYRSATEHLDN